MKRTLSSCLLSTLITISLLSPCQAETQIERSLAPGATYTEIHRTSAEGKQLSVYILKLDRSAKNLSFKAMKGQERVIGMASPRMMGESLRENRKGEVLATINADFYMMDKPLAGLPCGMIVLDGELMCSPNGWPALGFGKDGSPKTATVQFQGSIQAGGQTFPISELNRPRESDNQLVVYTDKFNSTTLNSKPGTDVVIRDIHPKLPLKPGVQYTGRVHELRKGATDDTIPSGVVILSGSGSAASFLESSALVGSMISFSMGFDPEWNQVTQALGGWPILIHKGQLQKIDQDDVAKPLYPRSAAGWNEHDFYFVAVDGRYAEENAGMTMNELAAFMQELGCVESVNLDGGGSTILAIRGNVENHPADGLDRLVSSGWAVINSAPRGELKSIQLWPENISILAGSQAQFRVLGTDVDGNPVQVDPVDIKWSLKGVEADSSIGDPDTMRNALLQAQTNNRLGTVDEAGKFTAAQVFRAGQINARAGKLSASAEINVWTKPAALFVIPANPIQKPGQTVHCSVLANDRAGRPLVVDASLVSWTADGVQISSDGTLIMPNSGRFTVTAKVAGVRARKEFEVR